MQLRFVLTGDLERHFAEKSRPISEAATRALRAVADQAKEELRASVRASFRRTPPVARRAGQNFVNAFRAETWPRGRRQHSLRAATVVAANASFAGIFETGGTVTARGRYLVVPLRPAVRLGLDRGTSRTGRLRKWAQIDRAAQLMGGLRPIPSRSGMVLGADREAAARHGLRPRRKRQSFVPLFALVRQVTLPRKLNFARIVARADRRLPELFARFLRDG